MNRNVPGTILVVEDNRDELLLYELAFKRAGCHVHLHHVPNAQQAIRYLGGKGAYSNRHRHPFPCCIICDLKMPGGSGFDLLRARMDNADWRVIPTVILSGSGDTDDIKKCILCGATAYFTKRHAMDETTHLLKVIFEFVQLAEHPDSDRSGKLLRTHSQGKLSEHD